VSDVQQRTMSLAVEKFLATRASNASHLTGLFSLSPRQW